jgi:hypothetical protein
MNKNPAESPYTRRMPPKGQVLRKLRGKVRLITRHYVRVSLFARGSSEIIGDLKRKDLPKGWKFTKFQIFDYLIVRVKGKPHRIVLRNVKKKFLSKKTIEKIRRKVNRQLSGCTEL